MSSGAMGRKVTGRRTVATGQASIGGPVRFPSDTAGRPAPSGVSVDAEIRRTRVLVEDLDSRLGTVPEALAARGQRMEEMHRDGEEIAELRSLMKLSYNQLDRRVTRLEALSPGPGGG